MRLDLERLWRSHSTGATLAILTSVSVVLSALPLPTWIQPLDFLQAEHPGTAFAAILFPHSGPKPGGDAHGDIADVTDTDAPSEDPVKEEVAPVSPKSRGKWVPPPRQKYEEMSRAVNADPVPVVMPCVEPKPGGGCKRFALDRFFARLSEVEQGKEGSVVRVVHFGDSLIASDHITDLVRQRLHERFGSAGRGMLLVDRLSRFAGRRVRTGVASPDWALDVITMAKPKDTYFGYTGASFTATKDGESSEFEVGPNRFVEIHFLAYPEGGILDIEVDGKVAKTIDTKAAAPKPTIDRLQLPEGTKTMRVVARTKGPRVFGVVLEAGVPVTIVKHAQAHTLREPLGD